MKPMQETAQMPGSLRGRLTLSMGGLSLVTLLAAGLYLGQLSADSLGGSRREMLQLSARSAAELLASRLQERELEIDLLRQSEVFTQGDLSGPAVRRALELRRRVHPEYVWLGVTDAQGRVTQATGDMLVGQVVSQRPWFKSAQVGVHMGGPHEAALLGSLLKKDPAAAPLYLLDFAAPIFDSQGQLRGVLASHALWDWISDDVESTVIDRVAHQDVELLIADRRGQIIFPRRYAGHLKLPASLGASEGTRQADWEHGGRYLVSVVDVRHHHGDDLGWRVVLRQPVGSAFAPVMALRTQVMWIGMALALVFAAAAYALASRLCRPIEELAATARHIERGSGQPDYPLAGMGASEILDLRNAMQSMTASLLRREGDLVALNASLEHQVQERTQALSDANRILESLAIRDGLTGLMNRRVFDDKLREQYLLMRRKGWHFTLLMIDVDHFKRVNDQHGHPVGDAVLKRLAGVLREHTRATDTVTRYGGEEFAIFLPDTPGDAEGLAVAENVRAAVASTPFPKVLGMTISVGVSRSCVTDATERDVLERADLALYEAKVQGRNRFVLKVPADPDHPRKPQALVSVQRA